MLCGLVISLHYQHRPSLNAANSMQCKCMGRMQCRSSSTQASGAGITSACAMLRRSAAAHEHVAIAEKEGDPTRGMWSTWVYRSWRSLIRVGAGKSLEHFGRQKWMYRQNCPPLSEGLRRYSTVNRDLLLCAYCGSCLYSSMQFQCIKCCQDDVFSDPDGLPAC